MYFLITDATADALPSVETQNTDISSVSLDVDTATISPGFIQPEVENQEQGDQGKPDLRRKKNNVIYYEFSDSEINDISDEGKTFILKRMSRGLAGIPFPIESVSKDCFLKMMKTRGQFLCCFNSYHFVFLFSFSDYAP